MKTTLARIIVCLAATIAAGSANADYRVRVSAQANVFGLPLDFDNFDQTNGVTSYGRTFERVSGSSHALMELDLQFGALRGRTFITDGFSNTAATIRFNDTLRFSNPGGGNIQVKFNQPVSGTITNPSSASVTFVQSSLIVGSQASTYLRHYIGGNIQNSIDPQPFILTVPNDSVLGIEHFLKLQLNGFLPGMTELDFSHTFLANVEVLTPGATFTSDSGASYAPVPEPASMAVLGVGVFALMRRRRK